MSMHGGSRVRRAALDHVCHACGDVFPGGTEYLDTWDHNNNHVRYHMDHRPDGELAKRVAALEQRADRRAPNQAHSGRREPGWGFCVAHIRRHDQLDDKRRGWTGRRRADTGLTVDRCKCAPRVLELETRLALEQGTTGRLSRELAAAQASLDTSIGARHSVNSRLDDTAAVLRDTEAKLATAQALAEQLRTSHDRAVIEATGLRTECDMKDREMDDVRGQLRRVATLLDTTLRPGHFSPVFTQNADAEARGIIRDIING